MEIFKHILALYFQVPPENSTQICLSRAWKAMKKNFCILTNCGDDCYSKSFLNHCPHWPMNCILEFSSEQSQTSDFRLENPRSDFGLTLTFPEAKLSSCRIHHKSQRWLSFQVLRRVWKNKSLLPKSTCIHSTGPYAHLLQSVLGSGVSRVSRNTSFSGQVDCSDLDDSPN